MVRRLVLWDIDGTLVHGGSTGPEAFDTALHRVVGRRPERPVRMSGKTDPQIVAEYLAEMGVTDDCHLDVLRELELAAAATADQLATEGRALVGVEAALEAVAQQPGVVSSILTGNIRPNAELKLGAFGLTQWVDTSVGAYGSDHADRRELVAVALDRLTDRYGVDLAPDAVWIVGDTPRDLECARHAGARCLLVASGGFDRRELAALEPDALLDDLGDTSSVVTILTG
jgi:phosphoglycolate phosphatase-like HAD superfamily hydrolase